MLLFAIAGCAPSSNQWRVLLRMKPPLLVESLPEFAAQLKGVLAESTNAALAAQVESLEIVERCPCDAEDCASFYTRPRREPWGIQHKNVRVPGVPYWLVLDVVENDIHYVEIQDRPDLRVQLHSAFS